MKKTLDYYMKLNYPVEITKIPEDDGGGYLAAISLLRGCMSDGETPDEAFQNIMDAKQEWLQNMLERKMPIPEPTAENSFSGKFVVRLPKSLHRLLTEQSEKEGVSLNQFITNSLSYVIGKKHAL